MPSPRLKTPWAWEEMGRSPPKTDSTRGRELAFLCTPIPVHPLADLHHRFSVRTSSQADLGDLGFVSMGRRFAKALHFPFGPKRFERRSHERITFHSSNKCKTFGMPPGPSPPSTTVRSPPQPSTALPQSSAPPPDHRLRSALQILHRSPICQGLRHRAQLPALTQDAAPLCAGVRRRRLRGPLLLAFARLLDPRGHRPPAAAPVSLRPDDGRAVGRAADGLRPSGVGVGADERVSGGVAPGDARAVVGGAAAAVPGTTGGLFGGDWEGGPGGRRRAPASMVCDGDRVHLDVHVCDAVASGRRLAARLQRTGAEECDRPVSRRWTTRDRMALQSGSAEGRRGGVCAVALVRLRGPGGRTRDAEEHAAYNDLRQQQRPRAADATETSCSATPRICKRQMRGRCLNRGQRPPRIAI